MSEVENEELDKMMVKAHERYLELSKICKITVGELRTHLELYGDDCELMFTFEGGPVSFNRTKTRDTNLVCVELNDPTFFN